VQEVAQRQDLRSVAGRHAELDKIETAGVE